MKNLLAKALEHPHNQARESALDLLCQYHALVGRAPLDPFIKKLKYSLQKVVEERLSGTVPIKDPEPEAPKEKPTVPRVRRRLDQARTDSMRKENSGAEEHPSQPSEPPQVAETPHSHPTDPPLVDRKTTPSSQPSKRPTQEAPTAAPNNARPTQLLAQLL